MEPKFAYFQLVLFLLFGLALSNLQSYEQTHYMDKDTSTSDSLEHTIQLIGRSRAVLIKASAYQSYEPVEKTAICHLIAPKNYKLSVSVMSFNIPKYGQKCNDYLSFEGLSHDANRAHFCGSKEKIPSAFYTKGPKLTVYFHTEKRRGQLLENSPNFELVVTAFGPERDCYSPDHYRCQNQLCMRSTYVCDGYNNCGDNSDELKCKKEKEKKADDDDNDDENDGNRLSLFSIVLIIFAGVVLLILSVAVVVYKCRGRKTPGIRVVPTVSSVEQLMTSQSYTTLRPTPSPTPPQIVNLPPDNQPYNPPYNNQPYDNRVFQPYRGQEHEYGYIPGALAPPPSYEEATLRE